MLLTYLDESYTHECCFIAALMVPEEEARSLTAALDTVVEEASFNHGRVAITAELRRARVTRGAYPGIVPGPKDGVIFDHGMMPRRVSLSAFLV